MLNKVDFTAAPISNQTNATWCNILDSGIRAFRRHIFNPEAKLDIVFRDADGIGEGAHTREFFTSLMREIHSCEIFDGGLETKHLPAIPKVTYCLMFMCVCVFTISVVEKVFASFIIFCNSAHFHIECNQVFKQSIFNY